MARALKQAVQTRFGAAPVKLLLSSFVSATLLACSSGADDQKGKGGDPTVGYVVVQPSAVPEMVELAGRVVAFQSSEVRPQVSGLVQRLLFTEGSTVRAGQPLYQIDSSLYRASAAEAQANLNSAIARAEAARSLANRYKPLAEMEAVSKQEYADALASAQAADATIAQSRAQLNTAQINLRFATVTAPISGRIGRSLVTQGALVSASQADPLTTIQRLDPIYVDVQQSGADLLKLRRALSEGGAAPASAEVRLLLEDGTEYPSSGRVQFTEPTVNPGTGTVTLRAVFPNPTGLLLPGMFARARFAIAIDTTAFLVPQAAVTREPNGKSHLWVVGKDNLAEQRDINITRSVGPNWIVTSGLKAGDKVITQGVANLKPKAKVKPVLASSPQRIAPPAKGEAMQSASKR